MPSTEPSPAPPGVLGLYRALWRFAEGKRGLFFASSTLLVLSQLAKLAIPWLAGQAINTLQVSGTDSLAHAGWLMLGVFGASVLSWSMHGPGRILERSVAIRVRENLADRLYDKISRLPLAWHELHHSGEVLHRVDRTTHALTEFAQSQFIYLQNFVNLIGPIVALFILSFATGAVALVGYAVIGLVIVRLDAVMMRLADRENQAERRYAAALVDYLGNIGTVLALRLQSATRRLLAARLAGVFEPLRRAIVVNESKWAAVDLLNVALWCSLVALYAWLAQRGSDTLLLGNVFMVYQYSQQAGGVIVSISANYGQFARFQTDYTSAEPIWQAELAPPAEETLSPAWRSVEVRNLSFTHPRKRGEGRSLDRVGLALRRGERIALVGPSGSGKSTLLRALAGLYVPEEVSIVVDGVARPRVRDLAAVATLIPQDAEVFEGSLRDNLTFGADLPDAEVNRATTLSRLEPVLARLPRGLDTMISERGLNLSGGQKQRVALARGLVAAHASSILLLDEPTASLDPTTEAEVYDALMSSLPDTCIVSSIHRLHLLARFDRVVLMSEGRVVDDGPLGALLERQPLMRELWRRATDEGAAGDLPAGGPPSGVNL